mgnify:CR=1 FL=1
MWYHWSTSITIRIETFPGKGIPWIIMDHWSTSITIRIETSHKQLLNKIHDKSLKYIHYNKDWDESFSAHSASSAYHWSTSITIRIETWFTTFMTKFFSTSLKYIHYNKDWDSRQTMYRFFPFLSLKYIHYNKDWDNPSKSPDRIISRYHWSTSITIRIETARMYLLVLVSLIIEVHPLQ